MRRVQVFGRPFTAERTGAGWRVYQAGAEGKRGPEVIPAVPAFVRADAELLAYLADLYHEWATPERPNVSWSDE